MNTDHRTIAQTNHFIVLDKYEKQLQVNESYQTEQALELEFIRDLQQQGYEYLPALTNPQAMLENLREQLETLNKVRFSEAEW